MGKIIQADFNGQAMHFTADGWFNATKAAERYGKRPNNWLTLDETKAYIAALNAASNTSQDGIWHRTKRGNNGGTWLHPKLAVRFAQWLDVRFAVWCDMQVDALIRGTAQPTDWRKYRIDASSRFKGVCEMLNLSRLDEGKTTAPHHYANEARLINWAFAGSFAPIDRDRLSKPELRLLELLEAQGKVLLGRGVPYDERKQALQAFAASQRQRLVLPANDSQEGAA